MPRETSWSVPRVWAGETVFILGGGPSLQGFDAEILRGRGRVIAINSAGLARPPGEKSEPTPHAPWADLLYWADKSFFEVYHERLGEHVGSGRPAGCFKVTRHAPKLKGRQALAQELTRRHGIKLLPRATPYTQLSTKTTETGGWCGGGSSINLAHLLGARRIVLLGFDMRFGADRKHWHRLAPWPQAPDREKRYRSHHMPGIAAMAWPLQQAGVEVINCTPGSALSCFPIRPLEDLLMEEQEAKTLHAESDVSGERVEQTVDWGPQPEAADVATHRGLELVPMPQLDGVIAGLARAGALRVVVRLQGGDVVTRRTAEWWQRRLSVAFEEVTAADSPAGAACFECRGPRL